MKAFPIIVLLIINTTISVGQDRYDYNTLKKKQYNTLKSDEKDYMIKELTRRLSQDTLAISLIDLNRDLIKRMVSAAQSRTPEQRAKVRGGISGLSVIERLKVIGVANPEKYIEDQRKAQFKTLSLIAKYPEIKNFEPPIQRQILESLYKRR